MAIDYSFVKNWYGNTIPGRIDAYFARFASRSTSLSHQIADSPIRIDYAASTAYIDESGATWLPAKYFDYKFYQSLGIDEDDSPVAALATINGTTIHEALHAKHTRPYLRIDKGLVEYHSITTRQDHRDYYQKMTNGVMPSIHQYRGNNTPPNSEVKEFAEQMQFAIVAAQILEDIFIESNNERDNYLLQRFVDLKNDIILGERQLNERIETFFAKPDIIGLLNIVTTLKNKNLRSHEIFGEDPFATVAELILRGRDTTLTHMQRYEIALDIAIFLDETNENMPQDDGDGEGDGQQGQGQPQKGPGLRKNKSKSAKTSPSLDNEAESGEPGQPDQGEEDYDQNDQNEEQERSPYGDQDPKAPDLDDLEEELRQVIGQFEDSIQEEEDKTADLNKPHTFMRLPKGKTDLTKIPHARIVSVEDDHYVPKVRTTIKNVMIDPRFGAMARYLKYAMEVKHVPGRPSDVGSRISKKNIARIASDMRIFEPRNRTAEAKGDPQVIFLVDGSGSMTGTRGSSEAARRHGGAGINLAQEALEAAAGAHEGLKKAAIPNSIFIHSTGEGSNNDPMIYGVAAFRMRLIENGPLTTTHSNGERYERARSIPSNENFDGVVIAKISGMFTSTANDKVLIVLADGRPNGPNYRDKYALQHTASVVSFLRRKGVRVFVVSLTSEVASTNDKIYGEEYNIKAFGKSLDRELEGVIKKALLRRNQVTS